MEERTSYERKLRDHLIQRVLSEVPHSRLNGHPSNRLPANANFCFRFIEGESLLMMLDMKGICGSSGSACTSGFLHGAEGEVVLGRELDEKRARRRIEDRLGVHEQHAVGRLGLLQRGENTGPETLKRGHIREGGGDFRR